MKNKRVVMFNVKNLSVYLLIVHKWVKELCIVVPFTGKSAYLNENV